MRRRDRASLSVDARCELDAIDAVLAGEQVPREHAPTAELAITLRELRPRASEEFISALDARAERGFGRAGTTGGAARSGTARRLASWRADGRFTSLGAALWRPAGGIALALVLIAAVAVPLFVAGGSHRPARGPLPVRQFSGPATVESGTPTTTAPVRGAETPANDAGSSSKAAAATPSSSATAGATASTSAGASARLIERTATLDVGVAPGAIQSSAQRVFTLVSAFGGYVRQSSVSSGEPVHGAEPPRGEEPQRGGASFDIRVPSANLSSAIAALAHLGHVRSENDTTNDVTDQHASLRSSLGEAQAERSSLLAQLRKATGGTEVAQLKLRLRYLDQRIGQVQGQLRALDQRVTYTSLALSLTPESASGGAAGGGDLTPGGAAHDAATILDAALAVLVIAAAAMLPVAVLVIAVWIAIATTRRRLREHALDAS